VPASKSESLMVCLIFGCQLFRVALVGNHYQSLGIDALKWLQASGWDAIGSGLPDWARLTNMSVNSSYDWMKGRIQCLKFLH
jgi:hypothetical protein